MNLHFYHINDKNKNEYPQSSKFNRVCTAIIVLDADFAAVLLSNRKDTVYVRVSTANMETGKIRLDVYKHGTGSQEEKSPKPLPVYSTSCPVNSTGVYKFSLTLAAPPYKEGTAYKAVVSWIFSSQSSNGNVTNKNRNRQTPKEPKQYILKGKEVLFSVKRHIPTPKAEPSKANVNRTEPEKGGCPRCSAPITAEQLKEVFPKTSEKTRIKIAEAYNKHMKYFKMDTCWNKAHFFAQAKIEVGDTFNIKTESFNYSARRMKGRDNVNGKHWVQGNTRTRQGGYFTDGKSEKSPYSYMVSHPDLAEKYGRKDLYKYNDHGIQAANEEMIANVVYDDKNCSQKRKLGNTQVGDGWRFRGRGMIQITGREAYTHANKYTEELLRKNIINSDKDASLVGSDIEVAMVTCMAFGSKTFRKLNEKSNGEMNEDIISKGIGSDVDYKGKRNAFNKVTSKCFRVSECTIKPKNVKVEPTAIDKDLKIEEGIRWLESICIPLEQVGKAKYKVPYVQDHNRIQESGAKTMDCSELVGRYAAKIEWCKTPKGWTTYDMIDYTEKNPKWLIKHNDPNYTPKRGDIFLWRRSSGGGHTGVVIQYNPEKKIVTTIEAISSYVNDEKPLDASGKEYSDKRKLLGVIKMNFSLNGKHLLGHDRQKKKGSKGFCYFYTFAVHYSKHQK